MAIDNTTAASGTCVVDQKAVEQFRVWIVTLAARKVLAESHRRAQEAAAELAEARKVDADSLHRMVTL